MSDSDNNESMTRNIGGLDSWSMRRKIVNNTLNFCGFIVIALLLIGAFDKDHDSELLKTIASATFMLASGVIGFYVFGRIWDDKINLAAQLDQNAQKRQSTSDGVMGGTGQVDNPDKVQG
ncbi:MAG: hypothetical protein HRU78_02560 [Gammaproteobacteria bacterium]|nr:MAG: hypothetical protein HRU78_02560 [Gammaproteobacteria bacterium]